jgi:hypothetical protein
MIGERSRNAGPARGCIPRRRKDEYYYLFDEPEAIKKRKPSAAQLEALEKGRRTAKKNSTCSRCGPDYIQPAFPSSSRVCSSASRDSLSVRPSLGFSP